MGSISGSGFICRGRFGDHFVAGDHFRVGIISAAVESFLTRKRNINLGLHFDLDLKIYMYVYIASIQSLLSIF